MKSLIRINLYRFLTRLSITVVLAGFFTIVLTAQCPATGPGNTTAAVQDNDESDDWMFDNSTYTNDPKTGRRVDQYKKEKTPYRDPNAFFDSPMGGFGMFGDYFGGFYDNYNPLTYLSNLSEFARDYFYGNDSDEYYPYDGDPNEEENMDK
jgi:hypothetical protein